MKIYFSASIRGGRADQAFYADIIKYLSGYGQVLTEHIGNPELTRLGEDKNTNEYIYSRDLEWIKEADIIVAEVSTPSLGVGYEIATAVNLNKKILCLYRPSPDRKLSAMIAGNPNVVVSEYHQLKDAEKIFTNFFQ